MLKLHMSHFLLSKLLTHSHSGQRHLFCGEYISDQFQGVLGKKVRIAGMAEATAAAVAEVVDGAVDDALGRAVGGALEDAVADAVADAVVDADADAVEDALADAVDEAVDADVEDVVKSETLVKSFTGVSDERRVMTKDKKGIMAFIYEW